MSERLRSREGFAWTPEGTIEGLLTAAVVESTPHLQPAYEVIVVGAGFAGLIAARDISRYVKVLLLDARDRIGGRAWTANVFGQEFEMGAASAHWSQPHLYSELHRYDMHKNLEAISGMSRARDFFHLYHETCRRWDPAAFVTKLGNLFHKFFQVDGLTHREYLPFPHGPLDRNELYSKYDRLSLADRLAQIEYADDLEELLGTAFEFFGFADPKDVGFMEIVRSFALSGGTEAAIMDACFRYKIGNGGFSALARAILEDVEGDVACNAIVEKFAQNANGVDVFLQDGRHFSAAYVISTIPLTALSSVIFEPPLSRLRSDALSNAKPCQGTKFHFESKKIPAFVATAESGSPLCLSCSDHDDLELDTTYALAFGNPGHFIDIRDANNVTNACKSIFPFDVDLTGYAIHDWRNDPFLKTSWCFGPPGFASKYLTELQKPHGGRVFMASADWADGWRGWVDGAIEQGTRNARYVIEALQTAYQASMIKEEPVEN